MPEKKRDTGNNAYKRNRADKQKTANERKTGNRQKPVSDQETENRQKTVSNQDTENRLKTVSKRQTGNEQNTAGAPPQDRAQDQVVGTPYDDAYRTMQNDCRRWCIPMVNEAFEEHYTGREQIIPAPDEHFLNRQDGGEKKRVTDSSFRIMGAVPKKYHIECQSRPDGTMLVRFFEYDSQIALDDAQVDGYCMTVTFPRSAVLFLRHSRKTPSRMKMVIRTEAGEISHDVHVIRLQDYSLQEIFDKRLLFFIPFYIFCYEKKFHEIETKESAMAQLQADYRRIRAYLEELCESGQLTEFEKVTTVDMLRKVLDNIAVRHPRVKEGVGNIMGGKVLEHEAKTILRQGIEQGRAEGIEQGRAEGIEQGRAEGIEQGRTEGIEQGRAQGIEQRALNDLKRLMYKLHMTAEQALDTLDIPEAEREKYLELLNQ